MSVPRAIARRLVPLGALLLSLAAHIGAQGHAELLVGCDASGRLRVRDDATAPFPLPASRFPGIEGYAEVFPGFSTALGARAAADLQPVDASADLVFVLESGDDGIAVWNDHGTATMKPGESFRLGHPPFDSHPVWNVRVGATGGPFKLRLRLRDTTGRYEDSEVFAPAFALDDATEVFVCPMGCRGGAYFPAAGTCPECGMHLRLLSGRSYRVAVAVEGAGEGEARARAGAPATLRFRVESPAGEPVTRFEVVHEKLLHLILVSDDLSWFAHEHPVIQPDGSFVLAQTFPHAGAYTLFHDFTPPRVGMQVVPVRLEVEGEEPAPEPVPLQPGARSRVVDGYTVSLTAPASMMALVTAELVFRVERDGKPVTDLQPYLGTLGHLIVISADRKRFVHSHPLPPAAAAGKAPASGPTVTFSALFPAPGRYKAWGQFQHEGRVITADFVLDVAAPH